MQSLNAKIKSVPVWLWLVALTVGLLLPFVHKAFHVDDPLFLWSAAHIQKHPADFYGFDVVWAPTAQPMSEMMLNPPLVSYFIAIVTAIIGWSEIGLHLVFLVPACAVVLGTYFLAKKHCEHPAIAAITATLTPVFLISATTVMCDVMMLAFWIWAFIFWERGLENKRFGDLAIAGFLAGFCALTKYSGAALIPLFILYALLKTRRAGPWLAALLIPCAMVAGYELYTKHLYGHGAFASAAGFSASTGTLHKSHRFLRSCVGLIFAGGCYLPLLFYAPWLWPRKPLAIALTVAAIASGLWLSYSRLFQAFLWDTGHLDWFFLLQIVLFLLAGVHFIVLAIEDCWSRRDAFSILLIAWVGGIFIFGAVVNWTTNGRSFLPMMPALGILLARRVGWQSRRSSKPQPSLAPKAKSKHAKAKAVMVPTLKTSPVSSRFVIAPAAAAAALTFFIANADRASADAGRQAASTICTKFQRAGRTVWFEGHWGFQYYMQKSGARPLDLAASEISAGDVLVLPEDQSNVYILPDALAHLVETLQFERGRYCATMNGYAGAGFYASEFGPLPFVFAPIRNQRVCVFEIVGNRDFKTEPLTKSRLFDPGLFENHPK